MKRSSCKNLPWRWGCCSGSRVLANMEGALDLFHSTVYPGLGGPSL